MKSKILIFLSLLFNLTLQSKLYSQEETAKLPEYSYTEFFRMIEAEEDSFFSLEDANIVYDPETDSLFTAFWKDGTLIGLNNDSTIIVTKQLDLRNVQFYSDYIETRQGKRIFGGVLNNIVFKKWVYAVTNMFAAENCVFENRLDIYSSCKKIKYAAVRMSNCTIKKMLKLGFWNDNCADINDYYHFNFEDNRFVSDSLPFFFSISPSASSVFYVERNTGDYVNFEADVSNYNDVVINQNIFLKGESIINYFSPSTFGRIKLSENNLGEIVYFSADVIPINSDIDWNQFRGKIISPESLQDIKDKFPEVYKTPYFPEFYDLLNADILDYYQDSLSIASERNFNAAIAQKGAFYNYYKSKFNKKSVNEVYVEMKNLETKRFKYLYHEDKSFRNYFQWKINQFLQLFSEYGTEPAKAVVIAVYVIFFFALFYLFFPNSWDDKNKHRIMNRMLFFAKYFRRKEGMKEVFEEENKSQILAYEDFKSYIAESKREIPPYFVTLSKPIYYFSVANFRLRSKIFSKTDILKGKWSELSKTRQATTSIIMAFWLLGILLYDLFVKFFNALMLSINTFSTLGFGEIPIKGLPRYLAIIQGFVGWFMLTIFSVSLISQLLN